MQIFWYLPTHGDGRYLATRIASRTTTFAYLRQIAEAIDDLGYAGALLPTGRFCEDPWVVASSLIAATRRIKFLVALRPGLMSPTTSARMALTLDRFSGGRCLINAVAGGDVLELAGRRNLSRSRYPLCLDRRISGHLAAAHRRRRSHVRRAIYPHRTRQIVVRRQPRAQARDLLWGFIGSRARYSRAAR